MHDRAADRDEREPTWGGRPQHMAAVDEPHAIAFLTSPAGSFITGADLLVEDGLMSMSPESRVS
ncbi:hypothetical protein ABT300_39645 [Streptomyces sp. NPDC001027]|uniref:hypothetical protein n=1 Tax=Streptomyces sp. NPDC001027 TaxID=3154771 RepID=UPI00331BC9EE